MTKKLAERVRRWVLFNVYLAPMRFSAIGSLESVYLKKNGKSIVLSEQNIVDCSGPQGNRGYKGGWVDTSLYYIIDNDGIDTSPRYPASHYMRVNSHKHLIKICFT